MLMASMALVVLSCAWIPLSKTETAGRQALTMCPVQLHPEETIATVEVSCPCLQTIYVQGKTQ